MHINNFYHISKTAGPGDSQTIETDLCNII